MSQRSDYVVFTTLKFTGKEFDELDQDLAPLLVATSFQLNEINYFTRQISGTFHSINKGEVAGEFVTIQQNIILRKLTLALFEYLVMFEKAAKNANSRELPKNHELRVLQRSFKKEFRRLKSDPAFKIAERVRNKYAGHVDLNDIKNSMARGKIGDQLAAYVHTNQGNCYYNFAEEIAFLGSFSHTGQGPTLGEDEVKKSVTDWIDWILNASSTVHKFHSAVMLTVTVRPRDNNRIEKQFISLDRRLWGSLADLILPIYTPSD